ncbi:MAG: regulatory protein RecX [Anaerostipes sp.]|nr:regulatory protein RecX [Anaerostipes sp.]
MIVTKLEPVGTKKVRLYLDEDRYCLLYKNEVWKLSLREEVQVSGDKFKELNDMLLHRSKLKVMSLLKHSSRTRKELENRLHRLEFPEEIIAGAIAYVEGYHYIDDQLYVRNYISYYGQIRSKKKMQFDLLKKGITFDFFDKVWDEFDFNQDDILEEQMKKRIRIKGPITKANYQKNFNFFLRKGFPSSNVSRMMKDYLLDE